MSCHKHHHDKLDDVLYELSELRRGQRHLTRTAVSAVRKQNHMAGEINQLLADVEILKGKVAEAVALLKAWHDAPPADLSALAPIDADIVAQSQILSDAVAANPLP